MKNILEISNHGTRKLNLTSYLNFIASEFNGFFSHIALKIKLFLVDVIDDLSL
jgi:hypothetical protein